MELKIYDHQDKADLYSELKRRQLPYKVQVCPIYQKRTLTQNSYYFGVVVKTLSEEIGYYPHEIHLILLRLFAKTGEGTDEHGNDYDLVESTSGMDTIRIEKYIDDIKVFFLTDFKIYIPNPGENFPENVYTEKFIFKP